MLISDNSGKHVQELEILLFQAETRQSLEQLNALLHDRFIEIGASGISFNKAEALARLPDEKPPEIIADNFKCQQLSEILIQITYRSKLRKYGESKFGYSLRSSLWQFESERWQMIFHQGTPTTLF